MSLTVALTLVAALDSLVVGLLVLFCTIPFRLDRRAPATEIVRPRALEPRDVERWAA